MSNDTTKQQPNFTSCHLLLAAFGLAPLGFYLWVALLGSAMIRPAGHPMVELLPVAASAFLAGAGFVVFCFLIRNVAARSFMLVGFLVAAATFSFAFDRSMRSAGDRFDESVGLERKDRFYSQPTSQE